MIDRKAFKVANKREQNDACIGSAERKQARMKFNKEYWVFLWSSILIALSACLGTVLDAIIVGNLIDEDSVSAINISRTMVQFLFTLSMLLALGAGMLVGIQLGKKDTRHASYIFTVSMAACVAAGLAIAAVGFFFPDATTRLFCNNERFFEPTKAYLLVMMLGAPVYLLMWGLDAMVSVDGSPKLVSLSIFVDNVVHLVLDIVFIKYEARKPEDSKISHERGVHATANLRLDEFHNYLTRKNLLLRSAVLGNLAGIEGVDVLLTLFPGQFFNDVIDADTGVVIIVVIIVISHGGGGDK